MRLLILGGTRFVGRHITDAALKRGHDVTLFNRGKSEPDLFPEAERITGDRDGALDALMGWHWDTVIDVNGYVPRIVRQSVELLQEAVERYIFISTISVYRDFAVPGIDENYPVATLDDPSVEEITGETYGALKALCEQVVEEVMPGRALIIRPGVVGGLHDYTNRFRYWFMRAAEGGEMLAPEGAAMQVIDARDLARFTLDMAEQQQTGVYNAGGKTESLQDILKTAAEVSGSDVQITWVDPAFLLENGVQPWTDLPLWVATEDRAGVTSVSSQKALRAGLTYTPLETVIRDSMAWEKSRADDISGGMSRQREAELLAKWHNIQVK